MAHLSFIFYGLSGEVENLITIYFLLSLMAINEVIGEGEIIGMHSLYDISCLYFGIKLCILNGWFWNFEA